MKHLKKAYVGLVALLLVIPLALFPFVKGSSAEKRDLAAFPALWGEEGLNTAFFSELDTYLADHLPGRSAIISLNNLFKAKVFATSDEEKIVVGKEDWLYFAETLPDYTGEGRLSDSDLDRLTLPGGSCERTHVTRANVLLDSPQMHLPKTLCRTFILTALTENGEVELLSVKENRKRAYHCRVDAEVLGLRLRMLDNWGETESTNLVSFDFN